MSLVEQSDRSPSTLAEHEAVIERGLQSFVEVGNALTAIKVGKLYKQDGYSSFDAYMAERWDVSSSQGYRLMIAAATHDALAHELSPNGETPLPVRESQVRPLAQLVDWEKVEAWDRAVAAAGGEQPTAAQVEAAVEAIRPPANVDPTTGEITQDATHEGSPDDPPARTAVSADEPGPDAPSIGEAGDEGDPADLQAQADAITHSPEMLRSKLRGDVSAAVTQVYRTLVNKYDPVDLADALDDAAIDDVAGLLTSLGQWLTEIRQARPSGLRAIQGGRS